MPVRRIRRRYLGFSVVSDRSHTGKEVADAVQKSVLSLYGIHGLSLTAPALIEFDEEKQHGILRCSHSHLRQMRASIAFVTSIGESSASIHVKRASGTIKSLRPRGKK